MMCNRSYHGNAKSIRLILSPPHGEIYVQNSDVCQMATATTPVPFIRISFDQWDDQLEYKSQHSYQVSDTYRRRCERLNIMESVGENFTIFRAQLVQEADQLSQRFTSSFHDHLIQLTLHTRRMVLKC